MKFDLIPKPYEITYLRGTEPTTVSLYPLSRNAWKELRLLITEIQANWIVNGFQLESILNFPLVRQKIIIAAKLVGIELAISDDLKALSAAELLEHETETEWLINEDDDTLIRALFLAVDGLDRSVFDLVQSYFKIGTLSDEEQYQASLAVVNNVRNYNACLACAINNKDAGTVFSDAAKMASDMISLAAILQSQGETAESLQVSAEGDVTAIE